MNAPVLFYGVPQGCSFGSIVALEWLGEPYQLCRIEMLEQPWPALYAKINPRNLTPGYLDADDQPLSESAAILSHIAARAPQRGLGFAPGTRGHDELNQMLSFLTTDFFAAFASLWAAYEMADADETTRAVLTRLGRVEVAKSFATLDAMLASREWLVGGQRTVADAYLPGIARWADHHRLFDIATDYPQVARYLARMRQDPAWQFAAAIERKAVASSLGGYEGHVTLEALRPRLEQIP
ncbi:glutathione S-transferase family protein [Uliginosibacterium sp. H1]|uniref:glutathione S-transferase family protein n=1 Tax=Uliginosibacterium sp. H1 TaxID=3114757 RepID=UPI002E18EF3C|nr:glutathione S-transferase family protein [Uliginosibacterium sp. H1]